MTMPMLLVWMALVAVAIIIGFRWNLMSRGLGRFHRWVVDNAVALGAYRSLGWLITAPIVLVGGYVGFLQLRDALSLPDVELVFARPAEPVFWLENTSSRLVREPKYSFLLYNFSMRGDPAPYLNLGIPVKILDPIRPGRGLGPWTIKSISQHGNSIAQGHHLFGYAQVECPTCEHTRYYWIFADVGNFGFYAEIPTDKIKFIQKDLADIVWGGPGYLEKINKLVQPLTRFSMESNI
jgi:hypothetical protein